MVELSPPAQGLVQELMELARGTGVSLVIVSPLNLDDKAQLELAVIAMHPPSRELAAL